ncbi:gastrula zinc finger protein XlCGF8.2DB, partial [Austrofundulus limnaeus]|uniref:Gastrula zinc finger protein XlCGF8.2DB n=1 Tax=Austrofundulus limnaeus TaxID=52670 RepID=A0A2I4BTE6_AUSLI
MPSMSTDVIFIDADKVEIISFEADESALLRSCITILGAGDFGCVTVLPADVQQLVLISEDATEERRASVYQQNPELLHIRKEEELSTSLKDEQLNVEEETYATRSPSTAGPLKSDGDEDKPQLSQVHQHKVEAKDVPTQKSFRCDDCGKTFNKKAYLNKHKVIHREVKLFGCELCGRRFSSQTYLSIHMRVHTGQKPFACDVCEQRFTQKSTLTSHMRIHTRQKPFACDVCEQRFSHKSTLNAHVRIHTGQKPFVCDVCEQRFSLKSNLNRHMKIHTGQKPF